MKLGLSGLLTRAFINSPLTPLLLLAAIVAGALALASLPREEEPQISVPMVDIIVQANGYKADQAVELVTRPLEDIIKGIDSVEVRILKPAQGDGAGHPTNNVPGAPHDGKAAPAEGMESK